MVRQVSNGPMAQLEEIYVEQKVAADEDEPLPMGTAADEPLPAASPTVVSASLPEQSVLDLDQPTPATEAAEAPPAPAEAAAEASAPAEEPVDTPPAPEVAAPADLESITVFVESPNHPEDWACSSCTTELRSVLNRADAQSCAACGAPAPKAIFAVDVPVDALPPGGWSCPKCTLVNAADAKWCAACGDRRPVMHTRPAGPPHEVLVSHTYLDLLLFGDESMPRAKQHGRHQLVCKAWKAYEDAVWDEHFAHKVAYRWRYGVLQLMPSVTSFQASTSHHRFNNPHDKEKVLCVDMEVFLVIMLLLFNIGLIIGFVMVGNAADGDNMSDQSHWVLSIPFLVGAMGFSIVIIHWCLRCCWQMRQNTKRKSEHKEMMKQMQEDGDAVTLTTNAAKQLARTTSAMPKAAKDSIVLVDADGRERTWNGMLQLGDRALSSEYPADADTEYTAEIKVVDNSHAESRLKLCYESCTLLSMIAMPTLMVGLTAILFAAGTSAIVAFIPLQVALCALLTVLFVAFLKDTDRCCRNKEEILAMLMVAVPGLSLLTFCITYPLALDGTLSNDTPGAWAAALSPLFVWSGLVTVIVPCVGLVVMCTGAKGRDECCKVKTLCAWLGMFCVFGTVGVFHLCLIALCYKGADDWSLMSYAGLVGTILGSMVCFFVCGVGSVYCNSS